MANHLGTGISPQQFMDGMQKNQDTFKAGYEQFKWENEEDKAFLKASISGMIYGSSFWQRIGAAMLRAISLSYSVRWRPRGLRRKC